MLDPAQAVQIQRFAAMLPPERRAQLLAFLTRGRIPATRFGPPTPEPGQEELQRHLQALGYGGGHSVTTPIASIARAADDPLASAAIREVDEVARYEAQRTREADYIKERAVELTESVDDGPAYDATPKNKTFNRVNPLYNKHRNILGTTVNVVPGGPSLPVAWVQADDEDATVFTVTAYPPNSSIQFSGFSDQIRPYAKVTWGTRISQLAQVIVDIGLGAQFSLCGSAIFLELGSDLGKGGFIGKSYSVSGFLGYNTTQRQSPSPRTLYVDNLAAGQSKTFNVPTFATTVQYIGRDDTTAKVTLDFIASDGTTSFEFILAANAFFSNSIQISNDVVQLKLTNNGAGTINGRVVVGLSL